jgi:hypothetical protein
MLKLAEVAPIPMANELMATSEKPGFLRNIRTAWRMGLSILVSSNGTLHAIGPIRMILRLQELRKAWGC